MRFTTLCLLSGAVAAVKGQSDSSSSSSSSSSESSSTSSYSNPATTLSFTNSYTTLTTAIPTSAFTGSQYTYLSYDGQRTVATTTFTTNGTVVTSTSSANPQITVSSKSVSLTEIGGISSSSNATMTKSKASSTSSSARPSNTIPCNGYPEFCNRKYSNITMVTAHNSAFVVKNNAASNQMLEPRTQLNDGVRMLQGEVHWENNTLWNCHTNCKILNAGTWQSELEVARQWLEDNPYDVLTFLIVNSDFTSVENFVAPITNAGLLQYVYEPAYVPQYRDQWPTLGEMIIKNQRMVFFMDYKADQSKVPYILDEFSHMWETPFSPTNQSFPCTQQRPPNLSHEKAKDQLMYLANHNLNTAVDLSSLGLGGGDDSLLIPNTAELNITNGQANQFGRMGAMSLNCTGESNVIMERAGRLLTRPQLNGAGRRISCLSTTTTSAARNKARSSTLQPRQTA